MQWLFLGFLLLVSGCAVGGDVAIAVINGNEIGLKIADTPEERAQGLMHGSFLAEDKGMLFLFDQEQEVSFWMKNTLIPLDIIFINQDWEIIAIMQAEPCVAEPCQTYSPGEKILYVLEVNKGYAEKHGIEVGDRAAVMMS